MGPPSYIFVVRHGNRLDAADKQWHLSSPTPYDPPLTYSGWTQSRAVGAKINDLLRDRALEDDASRSIGLSGRKKRRYRVVIHSSPFLRCIQTSVAISAGLLMKPSILAPARRNLSPTQAKLASDGAGAGGKPRSTSNAGMKIVLRIDAFLGEWLSPTYFELITPPPGSVMMLASAKASLLKPEDYNSYPHFQHRSHANSMAVAPTSHLWGPTPRSSPMSRPPDTLAEESSTSTSALENLDAIGQSLPRTDSPTSSTSELGRVSPRSLPTASGPIEPEIGTYDPPVPAFSISSHAPIPPGYVNHAKDNCVLVDYQWDSMRDPYHWGDGGHLPEDWPDMHRRFRKGLQSMMDWYGATENPASAVTTEYMKPAVDGEAGAGEDDDEDGVETVVIIVSHGAGCNAMIGGITHQPVLIDVPISSVTMAVRKSAPKPGPNGTAVSSLLSKGLLRTDATAGTAVHQSYTMKIFANTEHVRSSTPPPSSSRSSSMANVFGARGRNSNSFSSPLSNGALTNGPHPDGLVSRSSSANASLGSLGSIRRSLQSSAPRSVPTSGSRNSSSTSNPGLSSSFTPSGLSRTPSIGLWSPAVRQQQDEECIEDDDDDGALAESPSPGSLTPSVSATPIGPEANGNGKGEESRPSRLGPTVSPPEPAEGSGKRAAVGGLWEGTVTPKDAAVVRDLSSSKRRWTVTEHP